MTDLAATVRKRIFDHFVETGTAPVAEQLMADLALPRSEVVDVLHALEQARHIALVPESARILMAFPFSAVTTPFRVTIGEKRYFANCAWDAVAFHAMLGSDTRVDSFCHHCGTPIAIEMSGGRATLVEPAGTLVYLALRPTEWWNDIICTCSSTMVFFASAEHRDASDLAAPADAAASLTPDQTHALSGPIYTRKLAIDYARPSHDELVAHFAAIGLTGPYWQI